MSIHQQWGILMGEVLGGMGVDFSQHSVLLANLIGGYREKGLDNLFAS